MMKRIKIYNPFAFLTAFEWGLWLVSLAAVFLSFFLGGQGSLLSLTASSIGVTALIFVAKGDVTGQILTVVFSLLYAAVSWSQHYYGEMITYLGMSAPIALFSVVSWLKHPFAKDHSEVRMERLSAWDNLFALVLTAIVTFAFYWILRWLESAELVVSTLSVFTSFLASYLLFRRSPYYALAYAGNDIVLIVLWVVAALQDPSYWAMVACFFMFLCNDLYAFSNWIRLRRLQHKTDQMSLSGSPSERG